jgi:hypothetical protein
VGQYQDSDGEITTLRRDANRLFSQSGRDPEVEIFPAADETFVVKAFDAKISFVKDAQGKVTGLIFHVGDQTGTLKKIK